MLAAGNNISPPVPPTQKRSTTSPMCNRITLFTRVLATLFATSLTTLLTSDVITLLTSDVMTLITPGDTSARRQICPATSWGRAVRS